MFGYKLDQRRDGLGTISGRNVEAPRTGITIPIGPSEPFQRGGEVTNTRPFGTIRDQRFTGAEATSALSFVQQENREHLRRCFHERGHLPRNASSSSMSPTLARRLQRLGIRV